MGPKKTAKTQHSPAQSLAKKLKAKYRNSPGKQERVQRALYAVEHKKASEEESRDLSILAHSTIYLQNSVIKGYHHYKIRPPVTDPPIMLNVDRKYTNIQDQSACLVWIPELELIDASFHDMVTDNERQLQLVDVAGLPVGHVPRELAPCFRSVLDEGGSVKAEPYGEPFPSSHPWPEQHEVGGGVLLGCHYIIYPNGNPEKTFGSLKEILNGMQAGGLMSLEYIPSV